MFTQETLLNTFLWRWLKIIHTNRTFLEYWNLVLQKLQYSLLTPVLQLHPAYPIGFYMSTLSLERINQFMICWMIRITTFLLDWDVLVSRWCHRLQSDQPTWVCLHWSNPWLWMWEWYCMALQVKGKISSLSVVPHNSQSNLNGTFIWQAEENTCLTIHAADNTFDSPKHSSPLQYIYGVLQWWNWRYLCPPCKIVDCAPFHTWLTCDNIILFTISSVIQKSVSKLGQTLFSVFDLPRIHWNHEIFSLTWFSSSTAQNRTLHQPGLKNLL